MMKEQKDKKIKVAFPHMGTISVAWSAALRKFGVEAYVPPYTSKKTLSLGVKNSPEAVCLPYKLILGNFIEAIEGGTDYVAMLTSPGCCRLGVYGINIQSALADLGYETKYLELSLYDGIKGLFNFFRNLLGKMGVQTRRSLTVSSFLKDAIIPKIFRNGETHLQRANRMAKPYLMRDIGGDALECVSDVAFADMKHRDGIIHVSPFTCMPEIMSQNIFPSMREDCEIPILPLILDEQTGRAGYITRIEAFVDLMRRKKRRKEKAKKEVPAQEVVKN